MGCAKLNVWKNIKASITLVCAALLCIFIFIPLISVCLSAVLLKITPWLISWTIFIEVSVVFDIIEWSISGALMALIIGFILKGLQVISTLWASLLVTIFYTILLLPNYFTLSTSYNPEDRLQLLLIIEAVLRIVFFWISAYGVAWFMEHQFRKSVKPIDAAIISDSKQ